MKTANGSAMRGVWKFVELLTSCGNVEKFERSVRGNAADKGARCARTSEFVLLPAAYAAGLPVVSQAADRVYGPESGWALPAFTDYLYDQQLHNHLRCDISMAARSLRNDKYQSTVWRLGMNTDIDWITSAIDRAQERTCAEPHSVWDLVEGLLRGKFSERPIPAKELASTAMQLMKAMAAAPPSAEQS